MRHGELGCCCRHATAHSYFHSVSYFLKSFLCHVKIKTKEKTKITWIFFSSAVFTSSFCLWSATVLIMKAICFGHCLVWRLCDCLVLSVFPSLRCVCLWAKITCLLATLDLCFNCSCFLDMCSEYCVLFLFLQHIPVVGSIFGDSFYDQQLALRQTNALSHQVTQNAQMINSNDRSVSSRMSMT